MTQDHHVHKVTNIMTNGIQQYKMEIDRNKQEIVCWSSDIPESASVVIQKIGVTKTTKNNGRISYKHELFFWLCLRSHAK
jgi:hypothetical protein